MFLTLCSISMIYHYLFHQSATPRLFSRYFVTEQECENNPWILFFVFFLFFGEAVFSRFILRSIFLSQKVTHFSFYLEDSFKKKKVLKKSRL